MEQNIKKALYTEAEVAKILGVSKGFLAKLRTKKGRYGIGGTIREEFIPFVRLGGAIRYRAQDIDTVIAELSAQTIKEFNSESKGVYNEYQSAKG